MQCFRILTETIDHFPNDLLHTILPDRVAFLYRAYKKFLQKKWVKNLGPVILSSCNGDFSSNNAF